MLATEKGDTSHDDLVVTRRTIGKLRRATSRIVSVTTSSLSWSRATSRNSDILAREIRSFITRAWRWRNIRRARSPFLFWRKPLFLLEIQRECARTFSPRRVQYFCSLVVYM